MRDIEKNPYTKDEARVAKWLGDKTGIGGGDDPIGFLIASHEELALQCRTFKAILSGLLDRFPFGRRV